MRVLIKKACYLRGHRTEGQIVPDVTEDEFDESMMEDIDGAFGVLDDPGPEPEPEPDNSPSLDEQIRAILVTVDHGDDEQWTDAGLVRMGIIEKALDDTSITREQVEAAAPGFRREQ